ncbi:hypothetical protein CRYUN_Cryun23aG0126000 [Craigia yunnanensis]
MLSSSPRIQSQLSEALAVIGKHDFPKLWPTLLPELVSNLQKAAQSADYASINGILGTDNSIFKKFMYQYKTNDLLLDLKYCLYNFAAPLLEIFLKTASLIDSTAASSGGGSPVTLRPLIESQRLCCGIFYSLNSQELPEFFEDHMREWMGEFWKYLTMNYPSLESSADGLALVDELRAAVCENISLYMEKNEEEFQGYLNDFLSAVWSLLTNVSQSSSRDKLAVTAMKFLTTDEGGKAGYTSADITPCVPVLMNNLFNALKFLESEENQYVMKFIMRVLGIADISSEIAGPCIAFEASLFPSLQTILASDVTEFLPDAFQLLAQLVKLKRPPISPSYMQIFVLLLSPDSWRRSSNVPALVRLLQAFLQKAPHELNQEGRLNQVLGIFNMLVSSPSTDEQGFYVLNTVIENLEYGVISPYMSNIWNVLFMRLQNNRTIKFQKSLVIFISLFLVKHGAKSLVDTMNAVQANIFLVILEQFWVPNLKLIIGAIELKLTAVASTRLICESPDRVEEEPENVGYTATFVKLYNAGKKEDDPLTDVKDPKQFLVASLAKLSALTPGRYPQIINENLEPANQAALLKLCSTYNCTIV